MDVPPPSSKKRNHDGSMVEDLNSGSLTVLPHAPYIASNCPTTVPPNGEWTMPEPPYDPPYGKWVSAPPPFSFLSAITGRDVLGYDTNLPPVMMMPPRTSPTQNRPRMMAEPIMSQFSASPSSSLMMAPPPPPDVSRSAVPPKFNLSSQNCGFFVPLDAIDNYQCRSSRKTQAFLFKNSLANPPNIKSVRKNIVRSSGASALMEKSLGIMWVALHGMDSMCVVARNSDLEQEMASHGKGHDTHYFLRSFWNVIVSEVEDIGGPSGEAFNGSVEPFGVVCEISGNNEVQKASSVKYDANKAIKFLEEEIKTGSAFTFEKTVMTAISAFQHLFSQKFEAHEIRVFAWKKGNVIGEEMKQEREEPDVLELLASLNGSDTGTGTDTDTDTDTDTV